MAYKAIQLADGGAHGDVYRGEDDFGRPVAIKFIRPSIGDADFAIEQANALARIKNVHVVSVLAIEKVEDPASRSTVMAIVMEWIDGHTLEKVLRGPKLSLDQVRTFGTQIIAGMKAIHAADVVHSDFHFKNVMIGADGAKIIDILYYGTLAAQSARSRDDKIQGDLNALRALLASLLNHSIASITEIDSFSQSLSASSTIDEINAAFVQAADPTVVVDIPKKVAFGMQRIADPNFVAGDDYAAVLSEEIPTSVIVPLILAMIEKGVTTEKHTRYLCVLFSRLNNEERSKIGESLSAQLDATVASGTWWPHLFMLSAFGSDGWQSLNPVSKVRLESLVIDDILVGSHDIHSQVNRFGLLGTWSRSFLSHFKRPEQVLENLLVVSKAGWNGQNYVAKYFLSWLPRLVKTQADEDRVIERLISAYGNDARILKSNFAELPDAWQQRIRPKAEPSGLAGES